MRRRILLAAVLLATACSSDRPSMSRQPAAPDSLVVARARTAADDLGRDLTGLLTSELKRSGPAAAIAVCADSAQRRTARHGSAGTMVRRVGTRVRNPANRADAVESAVLREFAAALAAGRLPADTAFTVAGAGGAREVRFLRPIRVAQPCLACHGTPGSFSPAVRELLRELYPGDQAVGYQVGDLRGAISVRIRETTPQGGAAR
jgi:hypothetical protein